ncbi:hypothetical protein CNBB0560 [Cryptococcus deneoformans B-3501A]|uniref:DUF2423 domain-containing protein n=1 Tax=Cryptococcus deneoformans (strain JEC21 / ATCC MYA-565) TaxID=214684 RepID=Q5KLI0_CRYD1|nr:hypothetical protein CNB05190 [Cryptococcus neoformans var. neoformans JEC21]XP_777482.1 hypothetical protein CNBB0560 [Cryptococcus neoformans var. neoformans B-3501A]AAW41960.1 hypothetical protein CNB05190 [Cryptococcus neoformans var. neoformans JEC21]EAL22835.1 hypothetical protein CNBB0560 [Cryptococcus neoformans var. neoformans B-3501A]
MAKSIRSKAKMASRARKRNMSHYAATEAARTQRLSDKLLGKDKKEDGDNEEVKEERIEGEDAEMKEEPKKISTSGYRGSRKEQWRTARGMSVRPKGSTKAKRNTRRR